MKRLRKLEGIVEELSGQIELEQVRHTSSAGNSPEAVVGFDLDGHPTVGGHVLGESAGSGGNSSRGLNSPMSSGPRSNPTTRPPTGYASGSSAQRKTSSDVHKKFGRLVLSEKGGTRYVSSALWSRINDEVWHIWQRPICPC